MQRRPQATSENGASGDLTISPLDILDHGLAQAVLNMSLGAYRVEAGLIGVSPDAFPPLGELVQDILASTDTWFGAWQDGCLVGTIALEPQDAGWLISRLVVDPGRHRQGIGRRLVQEALRRFPGQTFAVTTGAANGPALHLYRSCGFTEVGGRTTPEGIPILHLVRPGNALPG